MNKKKFSTIIIENIKTLIGALIIAVLIRSLLFQPFYIPSSSMEPTLLVGDRIFASKYVYGYSRHSFPFSPNLFKNRLFSKNPQRGDLVIFKTPADNRTDYIKRLIGLPNDTIQFIKGDLYINEKLIKKNKVKQFHPIRCGKFMLETDTYIETLPNGVKHLVAYKKKGSTQNTRIFKVPDNHYFFLGDNRDCSKDSRFLNDVGYVKHINLVGKAEIIFFSNDTYKGSFLKFWNLNNSFRLNRLFKIL